MEKTDRTRVCCLQGKAGTRIPHNALQCQTATAVKVSLPHESGMPPLAGSLTLASPFSLRGVSSRQSTGDQIPQDVVELMRPVAVPSNPQCKALFPRALPPVNEHRFGTAVPGPNDDVTAQMIIFTFRCFYFFTWHEDILSGVWWLVSHGSYMWYLVNTRSGDLRGAWIGWITVPDHCTDRNAEACPVIWGG